MSRFLRTRKRTTPTRNRTRPPRYVLLEKTQHWRIVDGQFFRDCVVLMDGQRRVLGIRDDLVAGVA